MTLRELLTCPICFKPVDIEFITDTVTLLCLKCNTALRFNEDVIIELKRKDYDADK